MKCLTDAEYKDIALNAIVIARDVIEEVQNYPKDEWPYGYNFAAVSALASPIISDMIQCKRSNKGGEELC